MNSLNKEKIQVNFEQARIFFLHGLESYQKELYAEAEDFLLKSLNLMPDRLSTLINLSTVLIKLEKLDLAQEIINKALTLHPDNEGMFNNQGLLFAKNKDWPMALKSYDRAIDIKPDYAEAHSNRGVVLQELKRLDAALDSYERAIQIKSDFAEAYYNRGNLFKEINQLDVALDSYEKAIQFGSAYVEAYTNRGNVLHDLKRLDLAQESYEKAIHLRPDHAEAHYGLGNVLLEFRRLQEAIASYDRALEICPDYANAQWNKSHCLLMGGKLRAGWLLYEWGWKNEQRGKKIMFSSPLWLGAEDIAGKTILLRAEQGLGDMIQFCRFASLVKGAGARVLLEAPKSLVGLFRGLSGVDSVLELGKPLPHFDCHCPLMSLPLAFGIELFSIPASTAYLSAEEEKVRFWRGRLHTGSRLKVGVVWQTGFRPDQPERWGFDNRRNVPLKIFSNGLNVLDADFFSLQKGEPAESEILNREIEYWQNGNFFNFTNELLDFTDTAGLIANLDVVVSVDTSVAHLAAAMGKPTFILNCFDTCWRWMLDRDDSPWYKSVKLYRQDETRRWEPVLARLAKDLEKLTVRA